MKFGSTAIERCEGAILAHSFKADGIFLKKGKVISRQDITRLADLGIKELVVANLDDADIIEDEAATDIANALSIAGIDIADAGTGRVNFHAIVDGVFVVSKEIVDAINKVDPSITFATLANYERVKTGRMVATVKIIPYAISSISLKQVMGCVADKLVMSVQAFKPKRIVVISTKLDGLKDSTIEKTATVLSQRLAGTKAEITDHHIVAHDHQSVQKQIEACRNEFDVLILFGASAISDKDDVIPLALKSTSGRIIRFGMPVDPGNLLMMGELDGKPVIGAPGCARSPAENGFDFVLNRLLADVEVTSEDIASMGVGGLLMEIGSRPQPRQSVTSREMKIAALVLAAGMSRRMGKKNKLTLQIDGKPMVCHAVDAAQAAGIADIVVVTGHQAGAVEKALEGQNVRFVHNPDFEVGLSTSLKAGIHALEQNVTHGLVLLGDMPDIDGAMIGKMIDAGKVGGSSAIILATHDGKRGNPVLWPRAYFDALETVVGDTGAKHIIGQNYANVIEVELGPAASLDIDTPEAFRAFAPKLEN